MNYSSVKRWKRVLTAVGLVALGVASLSATAAPVGASDGTLEADFGVGGYVSHSRVITEGGVAYTFEAARMAIESDGDIVLAGRAAPSGGAAELAVVRLTTDGEFDDSFGDNGFVRVEVPDNVDHAFDVVVDAVEVLSDGAILVAGRSGFSESPYGYELTFAAKFSSAGALDSSWGNQGTPNGFALVTAPAVQNHEWAAYASTADEFVLVTAAARAASNGSRTSAVTAFTKSNGQPVALGSRSTSGPVQIPDLFTSGWWIGARVALLDGDQLVVVRKDSENPSSLGLSKIDLSGAADPGVSEVADVTLPSAITPYSVSAISELVPVADGVLVAVGNRNDASAEPVYILKFSSDGTFAGTGLAAGFGTGGVLTTVGLERVGGNGLSFFEDAGKYVLEGRDAVATWIYRLLPDGTLDTSFAADGKAEVSGSCLVDANVGMSAVAASGNYVFAGTNYNNELRALVLGSGGNAASGCSSSAPYTPPPSLPELDVAPTLTVGQVGGSLVACVEMGDSPANFLVASVMPVDFEPDQDTVLFPDTFTQRVQADPSDGLEAFPNAVIWDGNDFVIVFNSLTFRSIFDEETSEDREFEVGASYRVRLFASQQVDTYMNDGRVAEGPDLAVEFTFGEEDVDCGVEVPADLIPAPSVPAPNTSSTVPSSDSPSSDSDSSSDSPSFVTSSNAEQVAAPAGSAKLLVNGELVEVDLVQAPEELRRTVAGARSFAQVRALQALAEDMVAAVQAVLGEGVTLPITVSNTDTGATISGLVSDPVTLEPLAVPVEDVLLIVNENLALMVGGADGTGDPANIAFDGVLEFGEGGYVAVLAYGLTPGAAGEVVVMSSPRLLDTFEVGADGGVAAQAQIPSDLEAGEHTVVVAIEGQSASLGFRVLPEGVLPATGGESTPVPFAVLVLAAGGLAMLLVTRRRNTI